jgi:hypothetical protein
VCLSSLALLRLGTFVVWAFSATVAHAQVVRHVPQDYPTIQGAIAAASDGDSVLVSPGTYPERIDFLGKTITVESTGGPVATVIDGGQMGTVVSLAAASGQTPILRGFTVRNGYAFPGPGGVSAFGGPALIGGNIITDNLGCSGGGLEASFSSATIRANVIADNHQNCTGGSGGGVSIRGAGTAQLLDNLIEGNSNGNGGGVFLLAAGSPTLRGNVVRGNVADSDGGGIGMGNQSNASISNNVIAGNSSFAGGGIHMLVPLGEPGPTVVNNTIAHNGAIRGSAVFTNGFLDTSRLVNNILVGDGPAPVLECGGDFGTTPPVIAFNDVFPSGSGAAYSGICTDQTGVNGNISRDPVLMNALGGDGHLRRLSPAIDAGTNAETLPTDIDGDARPQDGNGDGSFVADMGADEFLLKPQAFFTVTPCRVADTRQAPGVWGAPALFANSTREFPVGGTCGIPTTASAVVANVTVVDATESGHLRLYPAGIPAPNFSSLNFAAAQTRANNAVVELGSEGAIAVRCVMPSPAGQTHFILDVTGYFE